jgi:hypothetical protein
LSEFRGAHTDTDPGGENLRMKASAQPTISAEVQDPRLTPGIGLVGAGVMKSERMVDRRAANPAAGTQPPWIPTFVRQKRGGVIFESYMKG